MGELFNGFRVSDVQDKRNSGDSFHSNVNILHTTELNHGQDEMLCAFCHNFKKRVMDESSRWNLCTPALKASHACSLRLPNLDAPGAFLPLVLAVLLLLARAQVFPPSHSVEILPVL